MDTKRRKEMRAQYKDRRPEMGVISFRCRATGETFLAAAADTGARLRRIRFQLSAGLCPNPALQALWSQYGEAGLESGVVRTLRYDDPAEDHAKALEALLEQCLAEDPQAKPLLKRDIRRSAHE